MKKERERDVFYITVAGERILTRILHQLKCLWIHPLVLDYQVETRARARRARASSEKHPQKSSRREAL